MADQLVPLPIKGGQLASQTVSWTSASLVNAAVGYTSSSNTCTGFATIVVSANISGASTTGGTMVFEASDDNAVTWYSITGYRVDGPTSETSTTLIGSVGNLHAWQIPISGFSNFRCRLSVVITGTGTANIRVEACGLPVDVVNSDNIAQWSGVVPSVPVTLADALVNATMSPAPPVASFSIGYNGATWDRLRTINASGAGLGVIQTGVTVWGTTNANVSSAFTLADALVNATMSPAPAVGAFNLVYNGTTWDRLRTIASSGAGLGVVQTGLTVWGTTNANVASAFTLADALVNATMSPAPPIGSFVIGFNGVTWDRLRTISSSAPGLGVIQTGVTVWGTTNANVSSAFTLADALVNATMSPAPAVGAFAIGFNGATWDRIRTVNAGAPGLGVLQVGPMTWGGNTALTVTSALSDTFSNPLPALCGAFLMGWKPGASQWERLQTDTTGRLLVSTGGVSGSAKFTTATSVAVGAGSSTTLSSAAITAAKTGKLAQVAFSSSVPCKVEITSSATGFAFGSPGEVVFFTSSATPSQTWNTPDENYLTAAATTTFQVKITNEDNDTPADVYVGIFWNEI